LAIDNSKKSPKREQNTPLILSFDFAQEKKRRQGKSSKFHKENHYYYAIYKKNKEVIIFYLLIIFEFEEFFDFLKNKKLVMECN